MIRAVEASLKRFQTHYIDLSGCICGMGSHQWMKSCGAWTLSFAKARFSISASRTLPLRGSLRLMAELQGWTQFIGLQIEYSLVERTVERELIPMAKALKLGFWPGLPLAKGVLSGKYHGESNTDGGRLSNKGMKEFLPEEQRATRIISAVKAVSEQVGRNMAQVALAWLRHQTVPVIPILGARKVSQLQDNLASLDLELSAEQLKSLDGASRIELGFPRVFTRGKWFVKFSTAAHGIACCSK
jgi:aryl-alcohol dehydrogenase-like predicted oxidoreductase